MRAETRGIELSLRGDEDEARRAAAWERARVPLDGQPADAKLRSSSRRPAAPVIVIASCARWAIRSTVSLDPACWKRGSRCAIRLIATGKRRLANAALSITPVRRHRRGHRRYARTGDRVPRPEGRTYGRRKPRRDPATTPGGGHVRVAAASAAPQRHDVLRARARGGGGNAAAPSERLRVTFDCTSTIKTTELLPRHTPEREQLDDIDPKPRRLPNLGAWMDAARDVGCVLRAGDSRDPVEAQLPTDSDGAVQPVIEISDDNVERRLVKQCAAPSNDRRVALVRAGLGRQGLSRDPVDYTVTGRPDRVDQRAGGRVGKASARWRRASLASRAPSSCRLMRVIVRVIARSISAPHSGSSS